jgi:hypothetical protein
MAETKPVESAGAPSERAPGDRIQPSRLPYLTVALLLGIVALLHLIPNDPALMAAFQQLGAPYRRMQRARYLASLTHNDPPLGRKLLLVRDTSLQAALGRQASGQPTVVLFIGSCEGCVERDLQQWKRLVGEQRGRAVVFVSRDSPDGIERFVKSHHFQLPIVADLDGRLANSVNAAWFPRAYAVKRDGTIGWIQPDDGMAPEAMARAVWPIRAR